MPPTARSSPNMPSSAGFSCRSTQVPKKLIQAFISAEDKTFYTHAGPRLAGHRAAGIRYLEVKYTGKGQIVGASTITQQVAKNFLLTNERSVERKLKEAMLAQRIEQAFTKDQILELYLNEIFLGLNSYGVAAASLNYFGKSLDELTLDEMAYLAALPKGPNNYHPFKQTERAIERRNWVLTEMYDNGYITEDEREGGAGASRSTSIRVPSARSSSPPNPSPRKCAASSFRSMAKRS